MMNNDDSWFLVISWSLFEVYRRDYLLVDIFKADVSGLSLGSPDARTRWLWTCAGCSPACQTLTLKWKLQTVSRTRVGSSE